MANDVARQLQVVATFEHPAQIPAWVEQQRGLTPRESKRVLALEPRWQSKIDQKIRERVNASGAAIAESIAQQHERIRTAREGIADVRDAARVGRIGRDEALRELKPLRREIDDANAVLEQCRRSGDRALAVANTDTADWLAEYRGRFPSLQHLYRVDLTAAYLAGDNDQDPLGGAS